MHLESNLLIDRNYSNLRRHNWLQLLLFCSALILTSTSVRAQITPDNTLGAESSLVRPNILINGANGDLIEGGARRGSNLFHSFSQFNINDGQRVYFANPNGVDNILTRVTGGQASNIFGSLGTQGSTNLFLINPNGIVFGANARLDVGGSFVATTANAVRFGAIGNFSATNPEAPPLLTIKPDALLFNQITRGAIANNSVAPSGLDPSSSFIAQGLRVPDGNSLLLVGGDIQMNGGNLYAFGGRVELGGLAGVGSVGLNVDGQNLSLSFPEGVERSDVFLSNAALVNVTAGEGGSIAVNARNLEITGQSSLNAGIAIGMGADSSQAGNIDINATSAINLNNSSAILNYVEEQAKGQGGNINLRTSNLLLQGGSGVAVLTLGEGKAGSLTVDAEDIQLIGTYNNLLSYTFSTGDAGNLTIKTNSLLVKDGAQIFTGTFGAGKGGVLTIEAQDVQLIGRTPNDQAPSGLITGSQRNSTGDGGNVILKTNSLLIKDGAQIFTGTFGAGKGGSVAIEAQDVQLIGTGANTRLGSGILASSIPNSTGDTGNITIKTDSLLVKDGSQILISTFGAGKGGLLSVEAQDVQLIGTSADNIVPSGLLAATTENSTGDAGNLILKTNFLLVQDGAVVSGATFGEGNGGSLNIEAQDVQLIGTRPDGRVGGGLFASSYAQGNAGNLTLKTNSLLVKDGAAVNVATFGEGKGGSLAIEAQDVQLIGTSADGRVSGLFASTESTEDAGDLTLKTNSLLVKDGAQIFTGTFSAGKGGSLTINASNLVEVIGSSANDAFISFIATSTNSSGNAGNLTLNARRLIVRGGVIAADTFEKSTGNGGNLVINVQDSVEVIGISNINATPSALSVRSRGQGKAGNLTVNSPRISLKDQGTINAESFAADGGNMTLNTDLLLLRRGGTVSATAGISQGAGNGGNITINSTAIAAVAKENSDIRANAFAGNGGKVTINTEGLFGIFPASFPTDQSEITASSELGVQGQIDINQPELQRTQGIIELPSTVIDATTKFAQVCPQGPNAKPLGKFIITGRGSLPPSTFEPMTGTFNLIELATLDGTSSSNARIEEEIKSLDIDSTSETMVEAQGWVRTKDGQIALIAGVSNGLPNSSMTVASCLAS
ncbi:filamentous hemagglutinin N-terminal domain-containing protein [Tolypothrix sp. PCC 7910]|uniref:two-partner secretion domain-containing protein n=1 Tax=Tolypothrix sp. PCC 7910 TaxID=2099387 RepID=UPI0014279836|nr:filamentous hemagglutinin N-terminal domain-containing protein [Tolypothrix sp. PCC 7910]QIR35896.1 filamentous hemagglutinin N-terminal domain-containing protein [Tolypothrix sp. PCC 7910]